MQTDLNRVQKSIQKLLNDLKTQKDLFAEEKEKQISANNLQI